jgi:hypothetical protein
VSAEWLEPIRITSLCWAPISAMRRRMKARIKSSLSSASFCTTRSRPSCSIAITSPSSRTRARTDAPDPRRVLISPPKLPAVWTVTGVSPAMPGSTTSIDPESTTRILPCRSPGSVSTSPAWMRVRLP